MVPSLTRHSYSDFESVQTTSRRSIPSALSTVDLTDAPMSNPWAIPYSSEARTLLVTRLHLVDDQWRIFARPVSSASTKT